MLKYMSPGLMVLHAAALTYKSRAVQEGKGFGLLGIEGGGNASRRGGWGEGSSRSGEACGSEGSDLDHG